MRVHQVDPSAYTPPYDRALSAALVRAGAEVELWTSRFAHGPVPPAPGVVVREAFYRWAPGRPRSRARLAAKLAQHAPDMLRYRLAARRADVVHFQWLAVQPLDVHLLPRGRPVVVTAHDVLPREPRPGARAAQRRLYGRVDAVVVHSEHGRRRLVAEAGADPARVHVIPHGAFMHLRDLPGALPPELPDPGGRPVVLFFGLLRPYKGLDTLLAAVRPPLDAGVWVVGMPRMPLPAVPPGVRLVPRFVSDAEAAALFRRATVAVLPYRQIDQSGVLYTALGMGTPVVLSTAGGFPEIEAAAHVPPDDPPGLRAALEAVLADPRPTPAAPSFDDAAAAHLDLYGVLLRHNPRR